MTLDRIYQERLLSRRVVHYSEREVYWECRTAEACECGRTEARNYPSAGPKIEHAVALGLGSSSTNPDKSALRRRWRAMVEEYTRLKLTVGTDKLAALQGCVDQMKVMQSGDYVFGLWQYSLLEDLCWTASVGQAHKKSPELIDLPTWSWASPGRQIIYPTHTAFVKHANVTLPASDNILGGELSLRRHLIIAGRFIPAQLTTRKPRKHWKYGGSFVLAIDSRHVIGSQNTRPSSWSEDHIREDFGLQAEGWDNHTQVYQVGIVRLAQGYRWDLRCTEDICIIAWRYGKAIPGSGKSCETMARLPIH